MQNFYQCQINDESQFINISPFGSKLGTITKPLTPISILKSTQIYAAPMIIEMLKARFATNETFENMDLNSAW
jgi:hypothetical protein